MRDDSFVTADRAESVRQKVKRCGHGFRRFKHSPLPVLLYAGWIAWPQRPSPPRIRTRAPYARTPSHPRNPSVHWP